MGNLLLYSHVTPNSDNIHYVYDDLEDFKTELSSHLVATVSMNNYRINNGIIKLSTETSSAFLPSTYKIVTYAINETDNTCYVVRSSELQGGFVIYYCYVDYWGTYIFDAHFNHINVLRCNRNVDIGIYDDIKVSQIDSRVRFPIPDDDKNPSHPNYFLLSHVYIVFCLTFNIEESLLGGSTTATGMYAMSLQSVYTKYITDNPTLTGTNPIDIARAWVGGIYGIKGTNFYGFDTTLKATVTKAFLIPSSLITIYDNQAISVATKSFFGDYNQHNAIPVVEVFNRVNTTSFTLNHNVNNNYHVGTMNKGVKITRTTQASIEITYQCFVSNNDIKVVVKQGENQSDISSEFEIDLTLNGGDVSNLAQIKNALKMGLTVAQGLATGNIIGTGYSLAGDIIGKIGTQVYGTQIGQGDGILTFDSGSYLGTFCPFGYSVYTSITDESVNARQKGAYFNCYVSSLDAIFNYNFIGTGDDTNDPTFVQANVNIDGIPLQAISEISNRFAKGVYLKRLWSPTNTTTV